MALMHKYAGIERSNLDGAGRKEEGECGRVQTSQAVCMPFHPFVNPFLIMLKWRVLVT